MLSVVLGTVLLAGTPAVEPDEVLDSPPIVSVDDEPEDLDRWRVRVDYLYWYLRELRVPPMLTFAPEGGSGVIGEPGTIIARGDGRLRSRHHRYIGVRATVDLWVNQEEDRRFQVRGFFLERDSSYFTVKYDRVPTLAVPYVDATTGRQQALIVQGVTPEGERRHGGSVVYSRIEVFGEEGNYVWGLYDSEASHLDVFVGGRFLQMRERLDQTASYRILPEDSTLVGIEDHLQTFNRFYGVQAGLAGDLQFGRWSLLGRAAVALGGTEQLLRTKAGRVIHTPERRDTVGYGLRVLPGNTGRFHRGVFDVVTDVELGVGFDVTRHIRLCAGYSFLTWTRLLRPGDQLEPINLSQVSPSGLRGPLQPTIPFREDFFWAHGVNVGLEVRW